MQLPHKDSARIRIQTQTIGRGAKLLLIEDVPVIYCDNCGESYLTAETLKEIEVVRKNAKSATKRPVNVARLVTKPVAV